MTLHLEITVNAKQVRISAPEANLALDVDSVLALAPAQTNRVIGVGATTDLEQDAVFVWPFDVTAFKLEHAVVFLQYYVLQAIAKFNPPNLWQRFTQKASLTLSVDGYETLPRREQLEFKYSLLRQAPIRALSINGQVVDAQAYRRLDLLDRIVNAGVLLAPWVAVWWLSKTPVNDWFSQQTVFLRALMAAGLIAAGIGFWTAGEWLWNRIAKQFFSEELTAYFFTIRGIRKSRRERNATGNGAKHEA